MDRNLSRFYEMFLPDGECWIWLALTDKDGYGRFYCNGRYVAAHRYSYIVHKGAIPEGMLILHSCDTPGCVNPAHLTAGTHQQNMLDVRMRGKKAKRLNNL